jgi:hypothetical protein
MIWFADWLALGRILVFGVLIFGLLLACNEISAENAAGTEHGLSHAISDV